MTEQEFTDATHHIARHVANYVLKKVEGFPDREHAAVNALLEINIGIIANVLLSLHQRGDVLVDGADVDDSCVMLMSGMAPGIMDAVNSLMCTVLKLPAHAE